MRMSRTERIVNAAVLGAYVVAASGVVAVVTIGLFFWIGQPWGTINDLALLVQTLALGPLMLAFYELGGRTPTRLAQAAQATGWVAILIWTVVHLLMIGGVVSFDYDAAAVGPYAVWTVAVIVIGLWIAGANLLAGPWLGRLRWLGMVSGLGWVLIGLGLLLGGMDHPLSFVGGIGYQLVFPIWAFLMARGLSTRTVERQP
jgi:hypothetical protein